ncbi:MAG: hypothetical protein OHK0046_09220 [Anaerolineae bacterium]
MIFPTVRGSNLEGRSFTLPGDFEGEYNIVLLGYAIAHQRLIDMWIPALEQITQQNPQVRYYEVPVMYNLPPAQQNYINMGMYYGIPDKATREKTITLYLNIDAFNRMLGLPSMETIYALLVDREGYVHWRAAGRYTPALRQELEEVITQLGKISTS